MLAPLGQAIDALSTAMSGLLSSGGASPAPEIRVISNTPKLVGIGGFVALNDDPIGEIYGRQLDAEVAIRVFGGTAAELETALTQANSDLMRADPTEMRRNGVFKLKVLSDRDTPILQSATDGIVPNFGRDIVLSVQFEHKPVPDSSEGVLDAVPLDISQATLTESGSLLYETEFDTDPLADFSALDRVGGSGSAGNWVYDPVAQILDQTGTTSGGNNGIAPNKTGTYLTLNPAIAGATSNFVLNAEMRSGATGGIGFVFRFQDIDNFGFVILESPANVRLMGKRIGGTGTVLDEGGADPNNGFAPDTWFRLRLLADGDRFELAIDEQTVLTGRDAALTTPGTAGFFCRRAASAQFRHFRLSSL